MRLPTQGQTQRQDSGRQVMPGEGMHSHSKGVLETPCTVFRVLMGPCTALLPLAPGHHPALAGCWGGVRSGGHNRRGQGDSTAQPLAVPPPLHPQRFGPSA